MIKSGGTVAFYVRRVSGAALSVYFFVWLARLEDHPLVPFGGDLGRNGTLPSKILGMMLIALLAAHAFEGLAQVLVERFRLMHVRGGLLIAAVLLGVVVGALHLPLFVAGVASP